MNMKTKAIPTADRKQSNNVSEAHIRLLAAILETSESEVKERLTHKRMKVAAKGHPLPMGA